MRARGSRCRFAPVPAALNVDFIQPGFEFLRPDPGRIRFRQAAGDGQRLLEVFFGEVHRVQVQRFLAGPGQELDRLFGEVPVFVVVGQLFEMLLEGVALVFLDGGGDEGVDFCRRSKRRLL